MRRRRWFGLLCLVCLPAVLGLALSPLSAAGDEGVQVSGEETSQKPPAAVLKKLPAPAKDKDAKRFPEMKEAIKDMGALEGLFTLYRFDPSDKNRDPEKLLAKIPHKLLGEDLLFATSISRGSMAGFMWGDALIQFKIVGDQLKIVTPDVRYVQQKGQPITEAVKRTYTDTFLTAVPIAAMSPQGDVLIDLENLLKSDLAGVSFMGGRVRPELSTWTEVKTFPDNVLINVDLALAGGTGGKTVGVSYAFRRLPKLGSYTPRIADPRGLFPDRQDGLVKKAPRARDIRPLYPPLEAGEARRFARALPA